MPPIPDPVERPKLAHWLWVRGLKPAHIAAHLQVTPEAVRKYCLEFGHPARAMPGREVLARISELTKGEVAERDFYPPHIRGEGPAPESAGARP